MIERIPEPPETIMYKKQHERNDSEAKILKKLEKDYHFKTNDEIDIFLEKASKILKVSPKEAYRKLIHFLGDNFSDIIVYEVTFEEQYPREKDSWLMTYSDEQWKQLWDAFPDE